MTGVQTCALPIFFGAELHRVGDWFAPGEERLAGGGLVCLILSFIGIGTILKTSETLYAILRLLGIAYLIYLGIKSFLDANKVKDKTEKMVPPEKGEAFKNGFLLIFLNPKNIIFFASFLPQFINHNSPFLLQTTILSLTYLIVGLINDYLYSFFASNIGNVLGKHSEKWIAYIGGEIGRAHV